MKNKMMIYVLIPLVASIWGLIFYKIITGVNNKEEDSVSSLMPKMNSQNITFLPDTFRLILNYRDPFLSYSSISFHQLTSSNKTGLNQKMPELKQAAEVLWPNFNYQGIIINQQTKTKTGILIFDKESILVKEGDVFRGYSIVRICNDSIIIGFKKVKKTIYR